MYVNTQTIHVHVHVHVRALCCALTSVAAVQAAVAAADLLSVV